MKQVAAILCLLLVVACNTTKQHEIKANEYKTTQYQVESVTVLAPHPDVKNDPNFPLVESLIVKKLNGEIQKMPKGGKPVDMVVTIDKLALYIHTGLALLSPGGDAYQIAGSAAIKDRATGEQISSSPVVGLGSGRGGPIGMIADASYTEEEKIDSTVSSFVKWSLYVPYPEIREKDIQSTKPRNRR
jgi:hypothetical protein